MHQLIAAKGMNMPQNIDPDGTDPDPGEEADDEGEYTDYGRKTKSRRRSQGTSAIAPVPDVGREVEGEESTAHGGNRRVDRRMGKR